MQDYFDEVYKALKEFHAQEDQPDPQHKPLYMLIKVDVDKDIVRTMRDSEIYAQNHCNKLEYELVECYYPDDQQYPYIAK